ncbi:MAG: hypothetical protein WCW65_01445 [Candidatus Paceibacterota bacterium]
MLGLSLSCRPEQRISLKQKYFGDFISVPSALCPKCGHKLNTKEIIAGFSESPIDFNTTCSVCGEKFLSYLIIKDKESGKEKETEPVIYMCRAQTLFAMEEIKKNRGKIGIAYLAKNDRQLFYNIIRHFGAYEIAIQNLS